MLDPDEEFEDDYDDEEEDDDEDDDDDDEEDGMNPPNNEPLLRLISEEEWLRLNALPDAIRRYDDGTPMNSIDSRELELTNREQKEGRRHDHHHHQHQQQQRDRSQRLTAYVQKKLEQWKFYDLVIKPTLPSPPTPHSSWSSPSAAAATATSSSSQLPLLRYNLIDIASRSHTVYDLAVGTIRLRRQSQQLCNDPKKQRRSSSPSLEKVGRNVPAEASKEEEEKQQQQQQENEDGNDCDTTIPSESSKQLVVLPLEYPREHVEVFFDVLLGKCELTAIPDDAVIDCFQLAHYLQCSRHPIVFGEGDNDDDEEEEEVDSNDRDGCSNNDHESRTTTTTTTAGKKENTHWQNHHVQLADEIIDICFIPSVNGENCMSFYMMAHSYGIFKLREVALNHMITSLSALEGEFWDELPLALRNEVTKMRSIMEQYTEHQQRHHGRKMKSPSSKTNMTQTVFFTSCREYIALLEEQYEYHVERLEDGRFEQREKAIELGESYRTHPAWLYAQEKIERHASKVKLLKTFLNDQRRIFG